MPIFLIALVALVLSFVQDGKPSSTPPNTSEQVSNRGNEVSAISSDLDPQDQYTENQESGSEQNESNKPEVSGIAADNTAASIELPTPNPQVAIESSSKLEESSGLLSSPKENSNSNAVVPQTNGQPNLLVVGSAIVGVLNKDLRELPVAELPEQGQVAVERTQGILP